MGHRRFVVPVLSGCLVALSLAAGVVVSGSAQGSAPLASARSTGSGSDSGAARASAPGQLTFLVALPYDRDRLHRAAKQVSTPGRPGYRAFLSLDEAARAYGASKKQRDRVRDWAASRGMSVAFDPTGLTAQITGRTSAWSKVYGGARVIATEGVPAPRLTSYYFGDSESMATGLPRELRGIVRAVIPVSNVLAPSPRAAFDPPLNGGEPFGPGATCLDGELEGKPFRALTYSPKQIHDAYGTTDLHDEGDRGKGARIAILAIGQSYAPGVASAAAECFDYRAPRVVVAGAQGMPDEPVQTQGYEGIESNLDLQTVAAVLPEARRLGFVEAAGGASFVKSLVEGFTTAYADIDPDVVTVSYGQCMAGLRVTGDTSVLWMNEDVMALGALLGTSILVASGDSGSSSCLHNGIPIPGQVVGYPAASPWVTAVGGTRIVLGEGNQRVNELVWNDLQWNPSAGTGAGAGTGGPTTFQVPWYQARVSSSDRRIIPDVVAHASGFPGWPVAMTPEQFEDFFDIEVPPDFRWVMGPVGGTSAATPFTAANVALIAARHGRLGLLNPWLYEIAASRYYRGTFYDVQKGNNLVAPEAACCKATRGFDSASGMGAPDFDALADLAAPVSGPIPLPPLPPFPPIPGN